MNPKLNNQSRYESIRKLILFGFLLQPVQVFASEQKPEIPIAGSTTVEELLRLDSRAALERARRQVFGVAPGATVAAASNDLPVLIAIYGTGRNLSAELLIAGRTVIYHGTGKQSVSGVAHGYGLERIAPPCVYLTKDQSQEIVCLESRVP